MMDQEILEPQAKIPKGSLHAKVLNEDVFLLFFWRLLLFQKAEITYVYSKL